MSKRIAYAPNFQSMPTRTHDPQFDNGVKAILTGLYIQNGGLNQEDYNKLPDWMKAYWQAYEYDIPTKKKPKHKKANHE
jgi:hypothetical protein